MPSEKAMLIPPHAGRVVGSSFNMAGCRLPAAAVAARTPEGVWQGLGLASPSDNNPTWGSACGAGSDRNQGHAGGMAHGRSKKVSQSHAFAASWSRRGVGYEVPPAAEGFPPTHPPGSRRCWRFAGSLRAWACERRGCEKRHSRQNQVTRWSRRSGMWSSLSKKSWSVIRRFRVWMGVDDRATLS